MRASFASRAICAFGLAAGFGIGLAQSAIAQTQPQAAKSAGPVGKRLCKPRLEATAGGSTRAQAQRKAIESWAAAAAAAHGDGFTTWTIAGIARTSCSLTPEGHRCRAAASPCRDLIEAPATKR